MSPSTSLCSYQIVELLISYNVDVNHQDLTGRTAMHVAWRSNKLEIAEILLRNGACIDIKKRDGNNAMETSLNVQKIGLAKLLWFNQM